MERAKTYVLQDGLLYHKPSGRKLCIPDNLRSDATQEAHDAIVRGGHAGIVKTTAAVTSQYQAHRVCQNFEVNLVSRSETIDSGSQHTRCRRGAGFCARATNDGHNFCQGSRMQNLSPSQTQECKTVRSSPGSTHSMGMGETQFLPSFPCQDQIRCSGNRY